MHVKFLPVILAAALLCQAGCAALPAKHEPLPLLPDPAAYVRAAVHVPERSALAGIARITVTTPETRRSYKTVFACSYPDALRLEVVGLFNQPGLYISADSEAGITLCVPSENAWYSGPATPGSMQRISGIRMDPFDIVRTLHGCPPGLDPAAGSVTCAQDSDSYACRVEHEGSVQTLWIDPAIGRVTRSLLFEQGAPVHDIRYEFSAQPDAGHVPETIMILFERYATSLEIRLQAVPGDPIEPGQLALHAPAGTVLLPIEAFLKTN